MGCRVLLGIVESLVVELSGQRESQSKLSCKTSSVLQTSHHVASELHKAEQDEHNECEISICVTSQMKSALKNPIPLFVVKEPGPFQWNDDSSNHFQ